MNSKGKHMQATSLCLRYASLKEDCFKLTPWRVPFPLNQSLLFAAGGVFPASASLLRQGRLRENLPPLPARLAEATWLSMKFSLGQGMEVETQDPCWSVLWEVVPSLVVCSNNNNNNTSSSSSNSNSNSNNNNNNNKHVWKREAALASYEG